MNVSDLKGRLSYDIVESIKKRGIEQFTPPQEAAIEKGLIEGHSMVIASPTASGKTLVAEIACVNAILAKGRKAVYIAPMRALVSEKYEEFKKDYPYIKVMMSIGDLDSNDPWLANYDMIFVSTEKFDSLIRHGLDWLQDIGCFIFDEVHMIGDASRGPTLELLITKLKDISDAQMIALSATIGNAYEIAEWLKAELVRSDFRPVKLRKGIVYNSKVYYEKDDEKPGRKRKMEEEWDVEELYGSGNIPETRIVEDTLNMGKQLLVFYSSRRNAEAGAARIGEKVKELLSEEDRKKLDKLSENVLNVLDGPTDQCIKLSKAIRHGVAFHHAGLVNRQRAYVEEGFRNNTIKAVCSTTTLGLGINMPAHTVLVKDTHRYDGGGSSSIGVNEVMQLFGRAGRPKYDKEGRALLIASSMDLVEKLYRNYIKAEPDEIDSSIGIAPVLRTHILAFIAEEFLNTTDRINGFLAKTFYGHQYKNMSDIEFNVKVVLKELKEWSFIGERDGALYATKLGKRVSELYIDPLSARWIIESLNRKRDVLGNLFMITNTLEMRPYVRATEEALAGYVMYRTSIYSEKVFNEFESLDSGAYEPERAFATAMMLYDWMQEVKEKDIVAKYSSTPGALFQKLTNADWLIYSAIEIAKILHIPLHDLVDVNVRLKYGIKEELLDLVRLEQIGRVRARILYMNGIRKVSDIRANKDKVARLLGKEIADKVMKQLE